MDTAYFPDTFNTLVSNPGDLPSDTPRMAGPGTCSPACNITVPNFDFQSLSTQDVYNVASSSEEILNANNSGGVDIASGRKRRAPIPPAEWEKHRQIITKLYQEDGLRLEDLCSVMKTWYGFDAEPQMYKKRLSSWGVRKYYSVAQKMMILKRDAGQRGLINGKPIERARLRRPCRHQGRLFVLPHRLLPEDARPIGDTQLPQEPSNSVNELQTSFF